MIATLCRAFVLILLLLVLFFFGSGLYQYFVRPVFWREQLVMDSVGGVVFFLLAAMMLFGANAVRKIAQRYGDILKKVDEA